MTEEQLSALLRLKRYEQPPAEYFDHLLQDIHRRQRAELLHRPLWRIAMDRVQTFFGEHSMSPVAYAGAMAAVLVVGLGTIGLLTPGHQGARDRAAFTASLRAENKPEAEQSFTLQEPAATPRLDTRSLVSGQPGLAPVPPQPRYIIDARPVSYEQSSSIRF